MEKVTLKDLIKPKRVELEDVTSDNRYGKFVVEPLERGFGMTIGNSLRRVLLSSLQGAAVVAVKIEGVMHEFSTIPGVIEDVTEIILNLKEVVLDLSDKEYACVRINTSGAGEVTAGMIQGDPSVKVSNPHQHIATLSGDAKLNMELWIKAGRGYQSYERLELEGLPEGTILIDAIYSPIRRVNFVVTNARVGQRTDYDKLTLEIWTNGSIGPRLAVAQAAHILYDQVGIFMGDGLIVEKEEAVHEAPKEQYNPGLFKRIDELELSVRSANCLENADIKYISELVRRSEAEMLRTKNFGRKSLNEIKEILTEMGLGLGMAIDNFPSREELDRMSRQAQEQSY